MDCGGKRSATPLSSARGAIKHSKASPRTKAVSRLRPACGTTALQMLCKIRGPSPTRQRLGLRQSPAAFHPRAQTKLYSATIACKRPGGASRCPSGRTASRLNPNFTFLQKTTACLRLVNRKSHIVNPQCAFAATAGLGTTFFINGVINVATARHTPMNKNASANVITCASR